MVTHPAAEFSCWSPSNGAGRCLALGFASHEAGSRLTRVHHHGNMLTAIRQRLKTFKPSQLKYESAVTCVF